MVGVLATGSELGSTFAGSPHQGVPSRGRACGPARRVEASEGKVSGDAVMRVPVGYGYSAVARGRVLGSRPPGTGSLFLQE